PAAAAGGLAVSALSAVALSLLHPIDATAMILVWNVGVAALLSLAGARYGRGLLGWASR
ncbi:NrsF family protein, partial [Burkholderia humptydooensis]